MRAKADLNIVVARKNLSSCCLFSPQWILETFQKLTAFPAPYFPGSHICWRSQPTRKQTAFIVCWSYFVFNKIQLLSFYPLIPPSSRSLLFFITRSCTSKQVSLLQIDFYHSLHFLGYLKFK